ncbi:hypothetical protein LTR22_021878 [Elasticomyces elasticus]|nr:hypothetical protein LTR22_021878 [Elasticomyces elasticus]
MANNHLNLKARLNSEVSRNSALKDKMAEVTRFCDIMKVIAESQSPEYLQITGLCRSADDGHLDLAIKNMKCELSKSYKDMQEDSNKQEEVNNAMKTFPQIIVPGVELGKNEMLMTTTGTTFVENLEMIHAINEVLDEIEKETGSAKKSPESTKKGAVRVKVEDEEGEREKDDMGSWEVYGMGSDEIGDGGRFRITPTDERDGTEYFT